MKKEIGSIFPLSDCRITSAMSEKTSFTDDRIYYSLCREALSDIALSRNDTSKRVLIPAYTCQTVITPFEEAGWECIYYPISKGLRIGEKQLLKLVEEYHPSLVVVHPYFGMDLNDKETSVLQGIHDGGIKVVLDLTQCICIIPANLILPLLELFSHIRDLLRNQRKDGPVVFIGQERASRYHSPGNIALAAGLIQNNG